MLDTVLSILVIDDDKDVRWSLNNYLMNRNHQVYLATSGVEGLEILRREKVDIVITDIMMPGMDGFEVLQKVRDIAPQTDVMVITGVNETEHAFRALREGAFDFFTKPLQVENLSASLQRTLRFQTLRKEKDHIEKQLQGQNQPIGLATLLGTSDAICKIRDQIRHISQSDTTPVLITGETGTGKELVARAIHGESARVTGPFIAVNSSAIPDTLVESEFYGHEKGAFTDAKEAHIGYLEQAHGGTLFLDEIGDMTSALQTCLLRALEESHIHRLGGTKHIPVHFRIVSATNHDLLETIAQRKFREDIFHRLNTISIHMPPLRERPEDILHLAKHFLFLFAQEAGKSLSTFSTDAIAKLQAHPFPGNVRELKNAVERAVIFCTSTHITSEDLQFHHPVITPAYAAFPQNIPNAQDFTNLSDLRLATLEKALIAETLRRTNNNLSQAARLLDISRERLRTRMHKYGLNAE